MAKVVVTFEDIPSPDDPTQIGVRLDMNTDRNGEPPQLAGAPTPAMLFGLAVKRIYQQRVLENLIVFVCQDVLRVPPPVESKVTDVNSID